MDIKKLALACFCVFSIQAMSRDEVAQDDVFLFIGILPDTLQAKIFAYLFLPVKSLKETMVKFRIFYTKVAKLIYRNDEKMGEVIRKMLNVTDDAITPRIQTVLYDAFIRSCAQHFFASENEEARTIANMRVAIILGTKEAGAWLNGYLRNRANVAENYLSFIVLKGELSSARFLLRTFDSSLISAFNPHMLFALLSQFPVNLEMLKLLLCYINPAQFVDRETGDTVLHMIAARSIFFTDKKRDYEFRTKMLENFLCYGAQINAINTMGQTSLMLAIKGKHISIAQFLLDKGATAEGRERDSNNTLLHCLGYISFTDEDKMLSEELTQKFIDIVLKLGMDINVINMMGKTPLRLAIDANNIQRIRFLLTRGANPLVADEHRQSSYDRICEFYNRLIEEGFTNEAQEKLKDQLINEYNDIMDMMDKYPEVKQRSK